MCIMKKRCTLQKFLQQTYVSIIFFYEFVNISSYVQFQKLHEHKSLDHANYYFKSSLTFINQIKLLPPGPKQTTEKLWLPNVLFNDKLTINVCHKQGPPVH